MYEMSFIAFFLLCSFSLNLMDTLKQAYINTEYYSQLTTGETLIESNPLIL